MCMCACVSNQACVLLTETARHFYLYVKAGICCPLHIVNICVCMRVCVCVCAPFGVTQKCDSAERMKIDHHGTPRGLSDWQRKRDGDRNAPI